MKKLWLVPVMCLVFGVGCSTPPRSAEAEWNQVEDQLEGSPLYADSLAWRPSFDTMVKWGISTHKARVNVLLCAKHSSKRTMIKLLREHKTKEAFQEALDQELAAGQDSRSDKALAITYQHAPLYTSAREGTWNKLAYQIERGPIYNSSLKWRSLYDRMVDMGMDPDRVRHNILRIARYGPSRATVEKTLEKNPTPDKLQSALDLAHSEALDRQWEAEGGLSGYSHEPGGEEGGAIKKIRTNGVIRGEQPAAAPQPTADEPPVEEPPADEPPADEPPADEPPIDETEIDEADLMDDGVDLDEDIDLDEDPDLEAEIEALEEGLEEDADEGMGEEDAGEDEADSLTPPVEDEGADLPPPDEGDDELGEGEFEDE